MDDLAAMPRTPAQRSRDALIGRDLDEIYLLLDHLSGRVDRQVSTLTLQTTDAGTIVERNLITCICEIEWPPGQSPSASQAASVVFKARDILNEEAWPATGMTVAFTIMVTDQTGTRAKAPPPDAKPDAERTELARAAYPHLWVPAARLRWWVSAYLWMLISTLMITALLSWNVASGKLILERLNQLKLRATTEAARVLGAQEGAGGNVPISIANADDIPDAGSTFDTLCAPDGSALIAPEPAGAAPAAAGRKIRLDSLCERGAALSGQRDAADAALKSWFGWWSWAELLPAQPPGKPDDPLPDHRTRVRRAAIFEQQAGDIDTILAAYVLPMLYGFLGAVTAVIRNLNAKIRASTLAPREIKVSHIQLALGIIVGACIGLFASPTGAPSANLPNVTLAGNDVALSASALSFLAGFGVKSVFRWLENLIANAFPGGSPDPSPQPKKPQR